MQQCRETIKATREESSLFCQIDAGHIEVSGAVPGGTNDIMLKLFTSHGTQGNTSECGLRGRNVSLSMISLPFESRYVCMFILLGITFKKSMITETK